MNKTTSRFDEAVTKLYTAYHNNTLDAMNCKHCAVGNLCDNTSSWVDGPGGWSRGGLVALCGSPERISDNYKFNNPSNYTNKELREIESIFLYGISDAYKNSNLLFENTISNELVEMNYKSKVQQKELQFKGLCAVIEYLAKLDGIDNPFNFDNLFNDDNKVSKLELELILN